MSSDGRYGKNTLVIGEIEKEWQRRLQAFQEGKYKAQSPEEGVLKATGYQVGNDGLSAHQRRALLNTF